MERGWGVMEGSQTVILPVPDASKVMLSVKYCVGRLKMTMAEAEREKREGGETRRGGEVRCFMLYNIQLLYVFLVTGG